MCNNCEDKDRCKNDVCLARTKCVHCVNPAKNIHFGMPLCETHTRELERDMLEQQWYNSETLLKQIEPDLFNKLYKNIERRTV